MWASITYTFSPSTQIRSGEVNQDLADLVAGINTAMPSGGIIVWSRSISEIPGGWYLCDGANGTPNLVGRFVQGAGSGYAVGTTGGNANHSHVGPDHNHYDDHTHNLSGSSGGTYTTDIVRRGNDSTFGLTNDTHTHGINLNSNSKNSQGYGAYTGGVNGDRTTTSADGRPPFLTLAFIMKS